MDEILKDDRFKHIAVDPRFKNIPRSQRKVKIDKRFQSMFKDKRFKVKYTVDKRGRPINRTSTEDLEKFYHLSAGSEDEESEDEGSETEDKGKESKKNSGKKLKKTSNIESKSDVQTSSKSAERKKDKEKRPNLKKTKEELQSEEEVDSSEEEKPEDDQSDDEDQGEDEEDSLGDRSNDEDQEDDDEDSLGVRSDDEDVTDNVKAKLKDMSVDYARGEGAILSDSSSDELTEDSEDDEEDLEHGWGELDRDADRVEESTRRLALCNMDWDRIRATDIMVLLNSFIPPGGVIHSVVIYPSEFGLERMKLEQERGPQELYGGNDDEGSDQEANDDNKYHMEKLRQYQLNRLRYYYAIIECDSVATADHLYKECDGREYESSATRLDLRFVPDDTSFDEEPRERCTEAPDLRKYKPRNFLTTALQQSKVDLTWDETDPDRAALTSRVASGDIDDDDLKAYLAYSTDESEEDNDDEVKDKYKKVVTQEKTNAGKSEKSGEESDDDEEEDRSGAVGSSDDSDDDTISKYRRALESTVAEGDEEQQKDLKMEISWDVGLQKAAEEVVKKKMDEKEERTPFEEMLHRRREKQKEKKRQKAEDKDEDEKDDESDTSDDYIPAGIDLDDPYFKEEYDKLEKEKGKKKKNRVKESEDDAEKKKWAQLKSSKKLKQKKTRRELEEEAARESNFKVDVNDERFSALYTSHLFNIDPTDPNFRKTSGVEALINEKLDRRAKQPDSSKKREATSPFTEGSKQKVTSKRSTENSELSDLVSSVKNKAQIFHNAKKRKLDKK